MCYDNPKKLMQMSNANATERSRKFRMESEKLFNMQFAKSQTHLSDLTELNWIDRTKHWTTVLSIFISKDIVSDEEEILNLDILFKNFI